MRKVVLLATQKADITACAGFLFEWFLEKFQFLLDSAFVLCHEVVYEGQPCLEQAGWASGFVSARKTRPKGIAPNTTKSALAPTPRAGLGG